MRRWDQGALHETPLVGFFSEQALFSLGPTIAFRKQPEKTHTQRATSSNLKTKEFIKSLIPERYRLLRYQAYERARYYPELFFSLGKKFECPFCRWQFRRLRPAGFDYPILKEAHVVGASYHLNDVCPRCQSNSRERLLYLYLKQNTDLFSGNKSVLHIAPEPNVAKVLQQASKMRYVSGDLLEANVMTHFDVMQMPFRAETFDVIICNHVLEHVSDDISAMTDLHRVLKVDGWAVLQVPVAMALVKTREDATATTEQQRIELFGQRDHVRLYSERDYVDRLRSVGFNVRIESFCNKLPKADMIRYALIPEEAVFICSK